jgi:hypothetical protein
MICSLHAHRVPTICDCAVVDSSAALTVRCTVVAGCSRGASCNTLSRWAVGFGLVSMLIVNVMVLTNC